MAVQFHVNGLCTIGVNFGSGENTLGYSQDGVTVELHYETEDVLTDKWGPKVPEDVLSYGQWGLVKMKLIKYDNSVLEHLQNRLISSDAYGTMPNVDNAGNLHIGNLLGQCNYMIPLYVHRGTTCTDLGSTVYTEGGWVFGASYLADVDSFTVGTKVTIHDLTFRCLPDASGILFHKNPAEV